MTAVLFLDMDGVLNSHSQHLRMNQDRKWTEGSDLDVMRTQVCPVLMWHLGFIGRAVPGLAVVISSTWRKRFGIDLFAELFKEHGVKIPVVGQTPWRLDRQKFCERVPRIAEIDAYRIEVGLRWDEVVILDDHHVGGGEAYEAKPRENGWWPEDPAWKERFVQTCQLDGLTYERALRVIHLFVGDAFRPPVIMM